MRALGSILFYISQRGIYGHSIHPQYRRSLVRSSAVALLYISSKLTEKSSFTLPSVKKVGKSEDSYCTWVEVGKGRSYLSNLPFSNYKVHVKHFEASLALMYQVSLVILGFYLDIILLIRVLFLHTKLFIKNWGGSMKEIMKCFTILRHLF